MTTAAEKSFGREPVSGMAQSNRRSAAEPVAQAKGEDDPKGGERFAKVDLRSAVAAIDKLDRRFAESRAAEFEPPEDFFEKGVPGGADLAEVEPREHVATVAAERAAAIAHRQAQERAGIQIDGPAHPSPPAGPVADFAAGDIPRADHHINAAVRTAFHAV